MIQVDPRIIGAEARYYYENAREWRSEGVVVAVYVGGPNSVPYAVVQPPNGNPMTYHLADLRFPALEVTVAPPRSVE